MMAHSHEALVAWTRSLLPAWRGAQAPPSLSRELAGLLRALRVSPLAYRALARAGSPDQSWVREDYMNALSRNMVRLHNAAAMRDLLSLHGIPVVLLKGGAFAVRYGEGDLGIRATADLDVAVNPDDLWRAVTILVRERGYHGLDGGAVINSDHHAIFLGRRDHAVDLHIDLHRSTGPLPGHERLLRAILSRPVEHDGWAVPEPELWLWSIAVHRLSGGFMGDLRELFDFAVIAEQVCPEDVVAYGNLFHAIGGLYLAASHTAHWTGSTAAQTIADAVPLSAVSRRALDHMFPVWSPLSGPTGLKRTAYLRLVAWPATSFAPASALSHNVRHTLYLAKMRLRSRADTTPMPALRG